MADFIVRKRRDFVFAVEDAPEKTFTLPAISSLGFEDVKLVTKANEEEDIVKRGKLIQEFILKYAPGLAELGLGGNLLQRVIMKLFMHHSDLLLCAFPCCFRTPCIIWGDIACAAPFFLAAGKRK